MYIFRFQLTLPQGTWQFMSVAYVNSQWTQPISVADTLESFFHVMLFFALRFLPHTLPNPARFVVEYFDTFGALEGDRRECSVRKDTAMRSGDFRSGKTSLQFLKTDRRRGNPLNTFIRNILRPFQARYEILNYESRLAEELLEDTVNPPNSDTELLPDDPALPRFMSGRKNWVSQPVHAAPPAARKAAVAPTDETRELAALLDTHTWVLDLFLDVRCPPMTPPFEWHHRIDRELAM